MLESGKNVSDAQAIEEALKLAEIARGTSLTPKKSSILKYAGFIKGGPKTNSAIDADEILYGEETQS
jgi:hypothetical protein